MPFTTVRVPAPTLDQFAELLDRRFDEMVSEVFTYYDPRHPVKPELCEVEFRATGPNDRLNHRFTLVIVDFYSKERAQANQTMCSNIKARILALPETNGRLSGQNFNVRILLPEGASA